MQENLAEAERRIEEARRTRAESLDLGGLELSELPASLGDLPCLRELYLGAAKPTEAYPEWGRFPEFSDLSRLAGLPGLQSLDLAGCEGVTDLAPLADLKGLQSLDLAYTGVTDIAPLAGLKRLQSLDLFHTGVYEAPPATSPPRGTPAPKIVAVRMPFFCRGVEDLSPLAGLQELQSLDLGHCEAVTELSPLKELQGLQNLSLDRTGVQELAPLAGLQRLQSLSFGWTGVTDLAPLAGLQGLLSLNLQFCRAVTDLTPLAGLERLQSLELQYCKAVSDLSPLTRLQGLRHLNLHGCHAEIPATLLRVFTDHPCLAELFADKAVGVPREILSRHGSDNCFPRLRAYLTELGLGAEAENEVKVILLGNGRVGKTQLCRRFRGRPFDESVESTHGVQIWREELRIRTGGQDQVFQVNWWDFGGQDIYHGTHALFLRSRAVFLILWTPQLENREEYTENEIPLRNQPLAYWLAYVRTLAGKGSPVIVVQSQCDRFADRHPDPARPEGFGFFECCAYSAKEDLGRDILEGQLRNAMGYLLERNGALQIGLGRAEVRRRLYNWRSKDQERKPEERRHRTLTLGQFRSLCKRVGGIVSWEYALDYFHHTGVVFYRPDLFSGRIVLDQTWALDAIYMVFHRGRAAPLLRDSGRFTREDLELLVWQEHSLDEQRLFLRLMESCGVCFPCGRTAQGEARYIAPDLLPRFEAVEGRLHAWKEEPGTPTLRLEYHFFHPAIIRGLMSEVGRRAGDLAEYWKYGLWFKDGRRDAQILVRDISTDDAPGAGALELKAQGRDPLGLLREIRKAIPWWRIGEKPEELLTLDDTTVARSALATVIGGRVLDNQNKPVDAAAFTAFFEGREHGTRETRGIGETNAIDINPQPLTERDKERREVFISYAWGDNETPEGRRRTQVCDDLYSALCEDGFLPFRDREQIQPGERISSFISHLTRADFVVAVISDKYLKSPYCMYELYKLWQKHQEDIESLAQCLVPIVLPDVKIGNFQERKLYLDYWGDQAESLEELTPKKILRLSSESFQKLRLIIEFAHHIDGILDFLQDIFMPRKLKVHLDDGFQAVREALQRQMGVGE